jgi:hypothetical protein
MVGGTLLKAYGDYQKGQSDAKELETQAKLDDLAAADARIRGGAQAGFERIKTSQTVAEQGLHYAESNVDPSKGTAASVQGSTAALGELSAQTIENDAAREAWGFETRASMARYRAKEAKYAGRLGALSTIIGGFAGATSRSNEVKNAFATKGTS